MRLQKRNGVLESTPSTIMKGLVALGRVDDSFKSKHCAALWMWSGQDNEYFTLRELKHLRILNQSNEHLQGLLIEIAVTTSSQYNTIWAYRFLEETALRTLQDCVHTGLLEEWGARWMQDEDQQMNDFITFAIKAREKKQTESRREIW